MPEEIFLLKNIKWHWKDYVDWPFYYKLNYIVLMYVKRNCFRGLDNDKDTAALPREQNQVVKSLVFKVIPVLAVKQ